MYIKLGDIVEVLGMDDDLQKPCLWWGEIMEYDSDTKEYDIYYISEKNGIWKYNETHDVIVNENINRHVRTKHGNYENAWSKFGFAMFRQGDDIHFIKSDNQVESDTSGSEETLSDVDTWSSIDETNSVSSFIDDSESENHLKKTDDVYIK
tara:strand:+ start:33516 stop:33968 length:453 start_codon:yes stop_codon:yes gene_type:complete